MKSFKSYLLLYSGFAVLAIGLANYQMSKTSARTDTNQTANNNIHPPLGPFVNIEKIASAAITNQVQSTPPKTTNTSKNYSAKASQKTITKTITIPAQNNTATSSPHPIIVTPPPAAPVITPKPAPVQTPPPQPLQPNPVPQPAPTVVVPTQPLDNILPVGDVNPNLGTGGLGQITAPTQSKPASNDYSNDTKEPKKSGNKLLFDSIY